ncbi:MAG: monovalent cation/H+ antiporter complex subunit F [Rhodospirillaceae bacterium]
MFIGAALGIIVAMLLALVRAIKGPSVYDRILAANMIGTKTVLLIVVVGYVTGRPEFADIAMSYALINFVGMIAVMKFHKYGALASPPSGRDDLKDL